MLHILLVTARREIFIRLPKACPQTRRFASSK